MQLALAAGILNVDVMLNSMSSVQFSEWLAFYQIYPFGAQADTKRFAMQQAHIVNAPHYKTKNAREMRDFMPQFATKKQTAEEQIAMLKGLR